MNVVSSNYKSIIDTSLALSPKYKVVIDNVEYLGDVIKEVPKISHSNTKFIGGFPTKNLSMEIYNLNNDLDIEDKEIVVYKGFVINDTIEYVKQGVFIAKADKITTNISKKTITITNAQDRTQLLDDVYESSLDWSNDKTHTGLEIVQEICTKKGITLASNTFNFANYSFKQPNFIETTTNREIISRLAEIGGEIAFFNCDGNLVIKSQTITGDTINKHRYEKLSRENEFKVNTIVLGKDGVTDDIVYPKSITGDRVEFKILDNPFVDLYREEMIEEVASYIIGMSYVPYNLTNVVDGYIYELNDVVQIIDKNNETFNAVILDISNTSRFKSDIKAAVLSTPTTDYNLAGSKKEGLNKVKVEVDHANNRITALAEEVKDIEVETTLTKEANGNPIIVEDAGPYPLESIEIEGKSYQETRSGKNKIKLLDKAETTKNGITYSVKDDILTVNGTVTDSTVLDVTQILYNLGTTPKSFTLNVIPISGTWSTGVMGISSRDTVSSTSGQLQWHQSQSGKLSVSKEYSQDVLDNIKSMWLYINKDSVFSNYKCKLQLTEGTEADNVYEQYGASPSPKYPSKIKNVEGVTNLFDLGTSLDDYFATDNNGTRIDKDVNISNYITANFDKNGVTISNYNNSGYRWMSKIITLEKNTDYRISGDISNPIKICGFSSLENNANGTQLCYIDNANTKPPKSFNSGDYKYYVIAMYPPTNAYFNNVQIEEDLVEHSYVPYGRWAKVKSNSKNLLKYPYYDTTKTHNGITFTDNGDGSITINGTSTAEALFWLTSSTWVYNIRNVYLPKGTYVLNGTNNYDINTYIDFYSESGKHTTVYDYSLNGKVFTIDENLTGTIRVRIPSGKTINNVTIYPMISLEGGEYEPYKENTALIDLNKENLFDKDKFIQGTWNNGNESLRVVAFGELYSKGTSVTIKNLNTTKYKFAVGFSTLNAQSGNTGINESGWVTNDSYTITAINDSYLWLQVSKLDNSNITPSELLETDFKIYEGTETDGYYRLASIGDTKDTFKDGVLTQRIGKYVITGNEQITYYSEYPRFTINTVIPKYNDTTRHQILSNYFRYLPYGTEDGGAFTYNDQIFLYDYRYTDVNSFKTHLQELYNAGTPVIVYYIFATPIEHNLNYEILELHEGYNNITTNDELEPNMSITYLTDSKLNSQYATKSELKVTADNITSEINSTLKNGYTTIEQSNAIRQEITDKTNQINLEVSKKVDKTSYDSDKTDINAKLELKLEEKDKDKVVSMINASAEEINLTSNRFSLDSDNLDIAHDGSIKIKSTDENTKFVVTNEDETSTTKVIDSGIVVTDGNTQLNFNSGSMAWISAFNTDHVEFKLETLDCGAQLQVYNNETYLWMIDPDSDAMISPKELRIGNVDVLSRLETNAMTLAFASHTNIELTQTYTYSTLRFDTIESSYGSKLTYRNGEVVIGKGVKKVRVNANVMNTGPVGTHIFAISHNDKMIATIYPYHVSATPYDSASITSKILEVNEGDTIQLKIGANVTGTFKIGAKPYSWLTVEVVE